jgi:hypothetical protein
LLTRHPLEYLYGCIGADITQAKKFTRALAVHCHSWLVGWRVFEQAGRESERAFALGYLSHLAADVYSHNHFVPTQLIVSYSTRMLRHVYWETRFDSLQDPLLRELVQDLRRREFASCDALVERAVDRTVFSFRTNQRIFRSVLAWQGLERWHRVMLAVDARSRFALPTEAVSVYNEVCRDAIGSVLREGRGSHTQADDPTGRQTLGQAMRVRRTLRALLRRERITPALQREIDALTLTPETLAALRQTSALRAGSCSPSAAPEGDPAPV